MHTGAMDLFGSLELAKFDLPEESNTTPHLTLSHSLCIAGVLQVMRVCVCTGAMVCVPHWVAAGSWTDELSQQEHHLWFQSSSSQPHRRPEGTMTTTTTTTQCSMDLTISNDAIRPTAATQSDWRTVCIQGGPVIVLKAKQWILTSYKSRAIWDFIKFKR